jgi:L,D-transpeptidase YcbB
MAFGLRRAHVTLVTASSLAENHNKSGFMWRLAAIAIILLLSRQSVGPESILQSSVNPAVQGGNPLCAAASDSALCILVESTELLPLQNADHLQDLRKFYRDSNYSLAWFRANGPTSQAQAVIQILEDADRDGLSPNDYDALRWKDQLVRLNQTSAPPAADLARFDMSLTIAVMRYISDLCCGRVDPKLLGVHLDVPARSFSMAEFLRNRVIASADLRNTFKTIEPPYGGYWRTKAALQHYLDLAAEGDGEPLPMPVMSIHPGEAYSGLNALTQRLRLLGDLPANFSWQAGSNVYEGSVVKAVQRFQRRHGLTADGVIGSATFKQLTLPLNYRIRQLQLTLERWRWMPQDLPSHLIAVNIPESVLRAYDDHHASLTMRVIVGKAFHDRQTPVFQDVMEYLIFRPYWNVPAKIVREEVVPSIQKNNTFLAAHHFELVDNQGRPVLQRSVSTSMLQELSEGKLRVRQKPGPDNSLGLVKFVFPNHFDVYLHGTPEQQLFSRSRRDFSHGCIRVEDPAALAEWVLKNDRSWNRSRIESTMNGASTITVTLSQPIHVLILYGTAFAEEDGDILFFDDIYGLDSELEQALARRSANSTTRSGGLQ